MFDAGDPASVDAALCWCKWWLLIGRTISIPGNRLAHKDERVPEPPPEEIIHFTFMFPLVAPRTLTLSLEGECRLVGQLIWIRRPNACTHVHRHSGSIANQFFYSTLRFTTPRHMKPRPRLLLLHPFSGTAPSPIAIHCPLSIIIMIVIAQGTCAGAQMLTLIVITVHHCFVAQGTCAGAAFGC